MHPTALRSISTAFPGARPGRQKCPTPSCFQTKHQQRSLLQTMEPYTYKTVYRWQLVLNLAYCALADGMLVPKHVRRTYLTLIYN
jgi:hypothetical protein